MDDLFSSHECREEESSSSSSSPSPLALLQAQVETALEALDRDSAREYRIAKDMFPELVRRDSKIIDFLRRENNDPVQAAHRLARYWKTRKWLFEERWLLPMTQSGSGALPPSQVEILRTGYVKIAPRTASMGTVLIFDYSRLPRGCPQINPQILFYFSSIMASEELVLIFLVKSGDRPPPQIAPDLFMRIIMSTACTTRDVYVVQSWEFGREHLLDYLGFQQSRLIETNLQRSSPFCIAENSLIGTLRSLEKRGFTKDVLPLEVGGELDDLYFNDWVRMRLSLEEIMTIPATIVDNNHRKRNKPFSAASVTNALPPTSPNGQVGPNLQSNQQLMVVKKPGESEQDFIRRRNSHYSRRRYHRGRNKEVILQGECDAAKAQNKVLRQDNQKLEEILLQAQSIVAMLDES